MNEKIKDDPLVKERLDNFIKTPSHKKFALYFAKRPKYHAKLYDSLCHDCSIKTRRAILQGNFKLDNKLSFFCDNCKINVLPLMEKLQLKCEKLYNK
jgi:hypothetical protein